MSKSYVLNWVNNTPIEEICGEITDKFNRQQKELEALKEVNKKLKGGIWEKEEWKKLKEELERMRKDYYRGFPISEEEWEKVRKFQEEHKGPITTIGGEFVFEFVPTSIGTMGRIKAPNGDTLEFQSLS